MMNEIEKLKEIFEASNIPISIEWLEACSQWCKQNVLDRNYTFDQLRLAVHDQWLTFDLRELETPLLPAGISEKKFMVLDGSFSLQIMQVVDISKPKHYQLQQIRKQHISLQPAKKDTFPNDSAGTGKRVLQLSITDGVQVIEAMEYEPIKCLNINLTPGTKMRLCGPVTIRRGRLMLQEKNIQIMGGEVDDLLIPNAAENVLARFLRLPENPNPQTIDSNLFETDNGSGGVNRTQQHPSFNTVATHTNNTIGNHHTNAMNIGSSGMGRMENHSMTSRNEVSRNDSQTSNSYSRASTIQLEVHNHQREDSYDEEMQLLMEADNAMQNEFNTNRNTANRTPDLFDDDFDTDQIDILLEQTNKENNPLQKENNSLHKEQSNIPDQRKSEIHAVPSVSTSNKNLFDEFIDEDEFFGNLDVDSLAKMDQKNNSISEVISITKLLQNISHIDEGIFRIHAKFKSVAEKLTLREEKYKFAIVVEDDSNELICQVHNDVISNWAGLTPKEMLDLKAYTWQDVVYKEKVEKAVQNIKDHTVEINHDLEIQINGKDTVPTITNIFY